LVLHGGRLGAASGGVDWTVEACCRGVPGKWRPTRRGLVPNQAAYIAWCETENFSVDKTWLAWLAQQPLATEPKIPLDLSEKLAAQEKAMIEPALRESAGRIFGPSGAATKLGIAPSTLESKIRSLKISKNSFKDFVETIPHRSCLESVQ
jgi:hypothetical protein